MLLLSNWRLILTHWRVALVPVIVAASFWGGWQMNAGFEARDKLEAIDKVQKRLDAEIAAAAVLSTELEAERRNIKTVTVEVIRRVPEVTTIYLEKPGDAPKTIPDAVFTRGFVGMWNYALTATPEVRASGQSDDPAGASDAIVRARVRQADILENHAINAGKYAECRAQLNKWIDWAERLSDPSGQ